MQSLLTSAITPPNMKSSITLIFATSLLIIGVLLLESKTANGMYDPRENPKFHDEDPFAIQEVEEVYLERFARSPGRCIEECSSDDECGREMTCQSNGCGHICL
ncbi:WAP four-disulfide core domain protein 18 [Orchesella cincta]|uniref:WAP four-disulfide core domain protein 18 n=1 Tax=Orchesella cincta TaxID=48709 RepID=A0A1D2MQ48_ORCCI|nr:WAP four-disulfide core domain protein 18 [Orchesella cincta]